MALTVDLLNVAQAAVAQAAEATPKKGDATLLHGKEWVTFKTAMRYVGTTTRRAIEMAAKRGDLTTGGRGTNRRISVESLLHYLPPNKSPN